MKLIYFLTFCFLLSGCNKHLHASVEKTKAPVQENHDLYINVLDFGAKGDGVTDDTEAFRKAAATKRAVFIPSTDKSYLISDTLSFYADVIGEHMAKSKIVYHGKGWAITMYGGSNYGVTLQNLSIHSSRNRSNSKVNQNGIRIWGSTHNRIQNVRTLGFDGIHIQLGNQDRISGSFWGRYSEIFCILWPDQKGETGLHISGQEKLIKGREHLPTNMNSNANVFENVVISGVFHTMIYIGGNNNKIRGGTIQWDKDGDQTKHVYYINGSGNVISTPYLEMADSKIPDNIIYLGPNTRNNIFDNLHNMFVVETSYDAKIIDHGAGNIIDIPNTIFGFTPKSDLSQNLIENSDFQKINTQGIPFGWQSTSSNIGTEKRSNTTSKGLISMNLNRSYEEFKYFLIKGKNSISDYPPEYFAGKTVAFSIYAKSNIKHGGQLQIGCKTKNEHGGIFGRATHSGSGEWELLTAVIPVPQDVEQISLIVRSSILSKTKLTGNMLFKDPVASLGGRTKNNNNRYLSESGGDIYGDIRIINGEIIRYNDKNEAFKLSFPNGEGPAMWKKI